MSIYVESEIPLLPCPFCGAAGKKVLLHKNNYEDPTDYVACNRCGCDGPVETIGHDYPI